MAHEKEKRNREIYLLSKKGGGGFSLRDIQTKFGFKSVKSVLIIVKREHDKVMKISA